MRQQKYGLRVLAYGMLLSVLLLAWRPPVVYGMEAPGGGGDGWKYSQDNYHWYYYDEQGQYHTGWLDYDGEWYWFDSEGRMADGGYRNVDGRQYYFFINGNMAWNQYIGMKYMDRNGQYDAAHDVRVIGSEKPTSEDRDMIGDALYNVPRGWIAQFSRDGWQLMFYKKKKYFAAPDTDRGIYYVYHSTDTRYKKVKFAATDALLQGFGEYVGYAAGCYKKDDARMQVLWEEQTAVASVLELPGYYAGNAAFYFGKLFDAYLDEEKREVLEKMSPKVCEVMDEILHMKDEPDVRARQKARQAAEKAEKEKRKAAAAAEEAYGPGVPRPQVTEE